MLWFWLSWQKEERIELLYKMKTERDKDIKNSHKNEYIQCIVTDCKYLIIVLTLNKLS